MNAPITSFSLTTCLLCHCPDVRPLTCFPNSVDSQPASENSASGGSGVEGLSVSFVILTGRGMKAETVPQGLALSSPKEAVMAQGATKLSTEGPRIGKLAVAQKDFLVHLWGLSLGSKELLFSGSERQGQMSKPFLRLTNHSLGLSYLNTLAREEQKEEEFLE